MLEAFSAYIKNIAVFLLFSAFVELLIPENHFKKYVRFVMGLLLLIAVLRPMLLLFQRGADIELQTIQKMVSIGAREYRIENGIQEKWNNEMILDIYRKELEQKWTNELQYEFNTKEVCVLMEISERPEEYGRIISVKIVGGSKKGEEMKEYMERKYDVGEILIEDS